MTENEQKESQMRAYENRDSILPGDMLYMPCASADNEFALFDLPSGTLAIAQGKEGICEGERVKITCVSQTVKANRYGPFVDYGFTVDPTGGYVTINGPDAQSLVRTVKPVKIANRDILPLRELLGVMQNVRQAEKMQMWQRVRMQKITASLSDMPGGGGNKGLDDAISTLDELNREQISMCRQYIRSMRRAQRILDGIPNGTMRAFVVMKYVMGISDSEIRRELCMTRRGFDRAVHAVQDAPDMASVKWQERYLFEGAGIQ